MRQTVTLVQDGNLNVAELGFTGSDELVVRELGPEANFLHPKQSPDFVFPPVVENTTNRANVRFRQGVGKKISRHHINPPRFRYG